MTTYLPEAFSSWFPMFPPKSVHIGLKPAVRTPARSTPRCDPRSSSETCLPPSLQNHLIKKIVFLRFSTEKIGTIGTGKLWFCLKTDSNVVQISRQRIQGITQCLVTTAHPIWIRSKYHLNFSTSVPSNFADRLFCLGFVRRILQDPTLTSE